MMFALRSVVSQWEALKRRRLEVKAIEVSKTLHSRFQTSQEEIKHYLKDRQSDTKTAHSMYRPIVK